MKTVIVINGKPRAGKDSTVEAMSALLKASDIMVTSFSSIDPVRDMLARVGFNLTSKTPEDRALLAEVGDSVEKHSQWRSGKCFGEISYFFDTAGAGRSAVMFLHVREPYLIRRIEERVRGRGWEFITCFVRSKRAEDVTSNAADMGVEDMTYDTEIWNDGTLDDLARACDQMLFTKGVIRQLSLLHR